jgi:hypothetical protein
MQPYVVGAKLTVIMAISQIFKYERDHGTVEIPKKDSYRQLHHWILNAKTTAKKNIKEGKRNPEFIMPLLRLLNKLGLIQLTPPFKFKDTPTTPKATKKKKTVKAPLKGKAIVTRSVALLTKKKSLAAQTKSKAATIVKAEAQTKANAQPKATSKKLPSQPTRMSPCRTKALQMYPHCEGTSFHSVINNPSNNYQHAYRPFCQLPSSIVAAALPTTNVAFEASTPDELPTPNVAIAAATTDE